MRASCCQRGYTQSWAAERVCKDFVEPQEGESREEERQREPQAPPDAPEAEDEESELGELGELSEETDTVGGATSASCQDLSTSVAFANGTLGAVLELKLVFFLLGCVPSVSFTAFYSSMGFFIDRCKNPSFFAQAACPKKRISKSNDMRS